MTDWIHVAETGDGRRYLNGVEVDPEGYRLVMEGIQHGGNPSRITGGQGWLNQPLAWSRALTFAEIKLVYETLAKAGA